MDDRMKPNGWPSRPSREEWMAKRDERMREHDRNWDEWTREGSTSQLHIIIPAVVFGSMFVIIVIATIVWFCRVHGRKGPRLGIAQPTSLPPIRAADVVPPQGRPAAGAWNTNVYRPLEPKAQVSYGLIPPPDDAKPYPPPYDQCTEATPHQHGHYSNVPPANPHFHPGNDQYYNHHNAPTFR